MVALVKNEMNFSVHGAFFLMVLQVYIFEFDLYLHFRSGLQFRRLAFKRLTEEANVGIIYDFAVESVAYARFAHYLNVAGLNLHPDFFPDIVLAVILNHQFESCFGIDENLVKHSFEGTGAHCSEKLGLALVLAYFHVFRTHYHVNRHILAETFVHAVEFVSDEGHFAVSYHGAVQDVALPYEISHKFVLGLVVYVGWGAYLLYLALVHHYYGVLTMRAE